jgi:hypothetical protein
MQRDAALVFAGAAAATACLVLAPQLLGGLVPSKTIADGFKYPKKSDRFVFREATLGDVPVLRRLEQVRWATAAAVVDAPVSRV